MSYGKHFASTYTGSMVGAGLAVFAVWGYVIANTRKDSTVELNSKMLAGLLGCSQAEVDSAVEFLCSPDADSRSPEHGGRRLLPIGAFLYEVPNHTQYSTLRNDEERREYLRVKKRESRERQKASTDVSTGQPVSSTVSTNVDVDVDVDVSQNPVSEANASETPSLKIFPDKQEHTTEDSSSSVRRRRKPKPDGEAKTHVAWVSYAAAYIERYGVEPVRNAKVSAQLSRFVDRVGREDAGRIAAFYVRSNAAWYVKKGHSVGVMLDDAEKLATEWRTGQQITDAEAREKDGQQKRGSMWKKLIEEATGHEPRIAEGDSGNG